MTRVVNLKREKYNVYIGRPGKGEDGYFGNPFDQYKRADNIALFHRYFYFRLNTDPVFRKGVEALKGKILGCFCKPLDCHGDVIQEYVDAGPSLRKRLLHTYKK